MVVANKIFISDNAEDIFSDTTSLIERELRRQKVSMMYASTTAILLAIMILVYYVFSVEWLVSFTILLTLSEIYFSFSVWKGYRTTQQLKQLFSHEGNA